MAKSRPSYRIYRSEKTADDLAWGSKGKDARLLAQFCRLFSRMGEDELRMVLFMAQKMARAEGCLIAGRASDPSEPRIAAHAAKI